MADTTGASDATSRAVAAVPWAVGGSTFFGVSWDVVVNILVSISVTLQIMWFVYEKANAIRKGVNTCRRVLRRNSK